MDPTQADCIVIGTGMGGATFGYALARKGKKVLFIEKGRRSFDDPTSLKGDFAEKHLERYSLQERSAVYGRAGRYTDEIEDASKPGRSFVPFICSGTGGSTALYGAGLSRFMRDDFTPLANFPGAESFSSLPESWPISFDDLEPYYIDAEILYQAAGDADPCVSAPASSGGKGDQPHLRQPQELSRSAAEIHGYLTSQGLHPYRLPLGCDPEARCFGCTGFVCPRACKKDASLSCLQPALELHGAELLANCEVTKLEADAQRVTRIHAVHEGKEIVLSAPLVVLAAGALETPRLLLASACDHFPHGLANNSGLVGKNLMRHYVDIYALTPKVKADWFGNPKEISFNDYCLGREMRLGIVQSAGKPVDEGLLMSEFRLRLSEHQRRAPAFGLTRVLVAAVNVMFDLLRPLLRAAVGKAMQNKIFMISVMEDLPREENRVSIEPCAKSRGGHRIKIDYRIHSYDRRRIESFRGVLLKLFKPYRPRKMFQADSNEFLAHVCGTCRMGDDPNRSVVNAQNKAHGIDNLYIVDASFFPSSSSMHPSLTIAANALRVADLIDAEMK